MHSRLLLFLSTIVLVGVSFASYGSWQMGKYKASCLEMRCKYGCVENEGTGEGYCCPSGKKGDKCWGGYCCQEGLTCSSSSGEGTCVCPQPVAGNDCQKEEYDSKGCLIKTKKECTSDQYCGTDGSCHTKKQCTGCNVCQECDITTGQCVADASKNNQQIQDVCHKCNNGKIDWKNSSNTVVCGGQCCQTGYVCHSGHCCPKATPLWDGQKCVACLADTDCSGELVCSSNKTCGCASGTTGYTKTDGTSGCCNNTTHVLASVTGSTSKACCPKETPLWDGGKCVACLADTDCSGELVCSSNKTCGCASGTTGYTKTDGSTGCCNNTTHVLASITGSTNKACCPKETPLWDGVGQKCVACLTNTDCSGELVCLSNKICGCASGTTTYTKTDGTGGCCNNTTHVLASVTGSTNKACCPKATPLWDGKKCVACLTNTDCADGKYCADDKTCKDLVGKGCSEQSDCGGFNSGYYCKITSSKHALQAHICYNSYDRFHEHGYPCQLETANSSLTEDNCYSDLVGTCFPVEHDVSDVPKYPKIMRIKNVNISGLGEVSVPEISGYSVTMNWWTAKNWCEGIGKKLIDASQLQIYQSGTSNLITNGVNENINLNGLCAKNQACDMYTAPSSSTFSPVVYEIYKTFGNGWWIWTSSSVGSTSANSCRAVEIRGTGEHYFPGSKKTTNYGRYVIVRNRDYSGWSAFCVNR